MDEPFQFIIEQPQNTSGHKKRPRLVTSCDNCRLKKIKCLNPPGDTKCEACRVAKVACKFKDRERYFEERSRAIAGSTAGQHSASPAPRTPASYSTESSPAPEQLRHSSSRASMHPYQSGSASSPLSGPSVPHGSSRPSHSPSTSTSAPFYPQDPRYDPRYRPPETSARYDSTGGQLESGRPISAAPVVYQDRYARGPPESSNFPARYPSGGQSSPASPVSPLSPHASPAPVAGRFPPSSATSSHFASPPLGAPREVVYHAPIPPPSISAVRPLFDPDHTLFPHAGLMAKFVELFFDRMGSDCPFITYNEIIGLFYDGRLTALLANGIAALAVRYTDLPDLVTRGPQTIADAYGDNAKAILRTARAVSIETVQGALLIAWLEYKSNRMNGFRNYCQTAMNIAIDAGISSEGTIAQNPDPIVRAQLRTTWTSLTHLHRTSEGAHQ